MIRVLLFIASTMVLHAQEYVDVKYVPTSKSNVVYGTGTRFDGTTDTMRMNIYWPTNDKAQSRPLVVWVHGGGFTGGSLDDFNSLCQLWASRGYVAVTVSYRLGIYGAWPLDPPYAYDEAELIRACARSVQDIRGALRFLVKNRNDYKIDTSRVIIGGASAGAIAVLHTSCVDELDSVPAALGNISPAQRGLDQFPRPALGSLEGTLHTDVRTPSIRAVLNIFGGLFSLQVLDNVPLPPLFSYHQKNDPIVPCAVNRAYWNIGFGIQDRNPVLHGTCALEDELIRRGPAARRHEAWIHNGDKHEVHDGGAVDKAAAIFCSNVLSSPTSVSQDEEAAALLPMNRVWTIYTIEGQTYSAGFSTHELHTLPTGVYILSDGTTHRTIVIASEQIAVIP